MAAYVLRVFEDSAFLTIFTHSSSQTLTTMRGWTFTQRGSVLDVLKLHTNLPTPSPASLEPNEVLVKVTHVSLSPGMLLLTQLLPHFTSNPWVPELEFSGTVVGTGSGLSDYGPSDEVFGFVHPSTLLSKGGVLAEYVVARAELLCRKPTNVTLAEASGLTGNGATAIQAAEACGLKQGDKVLLTGASGGLGTFTLQYFRYVVGESGYIVTTCSGANVDLVKSLGADEVIDYTIHKHLHEYLIKHHSQTRFDAIVDVVGLDDYNLYANSPTYLTEKGMFLVLGALKLFGQPFSLFRLMSFAFRNQWYRFAPTMIGGIPRQYMLKSTMPTMKDLKITSDLVEGGKIKQLVDSEYKMEDALEAYKRVMSQRARGKVVIHVS